MQLSRLFILRLTPGRDREQFLWKKWKRALNEVVLSCGHCFSGMPPFGGGAVVARCFGTERKKFWYGKRRANATGLSLRDFLVHGIYSALRVRARTTQIFSPPPLLYSSARTFHELSHAVFAPKNLFNL